MVCLLLSLFNDPFQLHSQCSANGRMIINNDMEMEQLCHILRYYPSICLKGLKKTMKTSG